MGQEPPTLVPAVIESPSGMILTKGPVAFGTGVESVQIKGVLPASLLNRSALRLRQPDRMRHAPKTPTKRAQEKLRICFIEKEAKRNWCGVDTYRAAARKHPCDNCRKLFQCLNVTFMDIGFSRVMGTLPPGITLDNDWVNMVSLNWLL